MQLRLINGAGKRQADIGLKMMIKPILFWLVAIQRFKKVLSHRFSCHQVIWPPLKEGARSFYATVKKMEFSPDHYRELFFLYQTSKAGNF